MDFLLTDAKTNKNPGKYCISQYSQRKHVFHTAFSQRYMPNFFFPLGF
jgi:hypothetical protein